MPAVLSPDQPEHCCVLCGAPTDDPIHHFRVIHSLDISIDHWPDGGPVIVDTTLTPADFEEGQ